MNIFEGKNHFLFLGKKQDIIDKLLGNDIPNHNEIISWQDKSEVWKKKFEKDGSKFIFLIAPDKESIYPELVDDNIILSERKRYVDIIIENSNADIIYPLDTLYKHKRECELYNNGDTHWNDIGAIIVFNELAQRMNMNKQINYNDEHIDIIYGGGDLCREDFQNIVNKKIKITGFQSGATKLFDSMLSFAGNIQIYKNEDKNLPSALVFCDSFVNTRLHFFSSFFSKLFKVSINGLGSIFDCDFLLSHRYDYIIYELAERNLPRLVKSPNFISYIDFICKQIQTNKYKHSDIVSFSKSLSQHECPFTTGQIQNIEKSIELYHKNFSENYVRNSKELVQEFKQLDFYRSTSKFKKIGAIVANCNPFHYGHRYLIEYASSMCDLIYVFVLQEDKSYFSFLDRFIMVVRGCNDLNNVIPIPSGRFVISNSTFPDYFGKEQKQEVVIDASIDIEIFSKFIAPYMGITDRFVGTEPFCKVTEQYNKQMSEILKNNNINFHEINRCKIGPTFVSATIIRELFRNGNMEKLSKLVPSTTFLYLQKLHSANNKHDDLCISCFDEKFINKLYDISKSDGDIESMSNFFKYMHKLHPNLFSITLKISTNTKDLAVGANKAMPSKDWPETIKHWALMREKYPERATGYTGGSRALKKLGNFETADALVLEGLQKFPEEASLYVEYGNIAALQENWPEAVKRWALMREKCPDRATGYTGGSRALKKLGNFETADALVLEGLQKFPEEASLYVEYGDIAMRQKNWPEAVKRWALMREKCPDLSDGYIVGGKALKKLGNFEVADALVLEGLQKKSS